MDRALDKKYFVLDKSDFVPDKKIFCPGRWTGHKTYFKLASVMFQIKPQPFTFFLIASHGTVSKQCVYV